MRYLWLGAPLWMTLAELAIAQTSSDPVTFERIQNSSREPQNWLTYSGNNMGQRYSLLTQVAPQNVKNLEMAWLWQARSVEKFEATSIVLDGILYTIQAPNDVVALDAATGRLRWTYAYRNLPEARNCCGSVNRGLAILGETLFMGTLDAHLIALDAKSGALLWKTKVAEAKERYAITHAPLVIKDKVIVGTAGGDGGAPGVIAAFDAKTGQEVWRFHTIPQPGEPGNETWSGDSWKHGGAAVWNTGAYDPESNLTYWGTGNPSPDWDGRQRLGDNLYSECVVALDADTGKLKWYYQFTPHDEMDYDATQVPVLADMNWQGRPRKVMLWANRNGLMYVLDRTNGQFLMGRPFVKVNWMDGFDETGRPRRVPGMAPSKEGTLIMPTVNGGTNWYPPSYSPRTELFYIPGWENTGSIAVEGERPRTVGNLPPGAPSLVLNDWPEEQGYGFVRAFDMKTGDKKWEFKMGDVTYAGVLTTASDLVFSGGREGYFYALNARTGELLWRTALGGQVNSGPMSYMVDGKQYIAVAAGSSLFAFRLKE
ncbi:MAG TPA: PQQ-dependent dehydrogenase, methanol/ethanol family [Bryobacteraceae bacterium]|nr:PQQ-dependent dehydrogenase, methanol/ethanol family [Bryobacteraceae bacterium]